MAIILGTNGNNILTGTTVGDTMIGWAGNDQLFGNGGNDRLYGGTQNDLLNGGLGIDTADYRDWGTYIGATAGVTVNLTLTGAQNTVGAGVDTLVGIENLSGTNFGDTLTGNSGPNTLWGQDGNDLLRGNEGDDVLNGGRGNNILIGGAGNDTMSADSGSDRFNGGAGNDILLAGSGEDIAEYTTAASGVIVSLNVSGPQNTGGAGVDTLSGMDHLIGSNFNDSLTGYADYNVLSGLGGNDALFGLGGSDQLNGGSGNDALNGGYDGDTLNGGLGRDTLTGGPGVDIFDYNLISDSPAGAGRDVILDFFGDGARIVDWIDLSTIDANTSLAGNQAFTYIGSAAFTVAGQLRYAGGILSGSTDADTVAEFEIQLVGAPALFVNSAWSGTDILL